MAVRPSTLLTVTVAVTSSALSTIMLVVPVPFISLLTPPETVLVLPLTVTVVEPQPVPPDLKYFHVRVISSRPSRALRTLPRVMLGVSGASAFVETEIGFEAGELPFALWATTVIV